MEFKDKYTINAGEIFEIKDKDGKVKKTIHKLFISNDAFALGDIIQDLINKIELMRIENLK